MQDIGLLLTLDGVANSANCTVLTKMLGSLHMQQSSKEPDQWFRNSHCDMQLKMPNKGLSSKLAMTGNPGSVDIHEAEVRNKADVRIAYERYLQEMLNIRDTDANKIRKAIPKIVNVPFARLAATINKLQELGFSKEDIIKRPPVLRLSAESIHSRTVAFQDMGQNPVTVDMLVYYKNITFDTGVHKKYLNDLNVFQKSVETLRCSQDFVDDILQKYPGIQNSSVLTIRKVLKQEYTRMRLDIAPERDIPKGITTINLSTLRERLNFLLNDVKYDKKKVIRNPNLLKSNVELAKQNIDALSEFFQLDARMILRKFPLLCAIQTKTIISTLELLTNEGMTKEQILSSINILTLSTKTVKKRLEKLPKIPTLHLLRHDRTFVNLVFYFKKVVRRLRQLRDLKYPYISTNLLFTAENNYLHMIRKGWNIGAFRQSVLYIMNKCPGPEERVIVDRLRFQTRHVRLINIFNTSDVMNFLFSKGVTAEQFLSAVGIVQYDLQLVKSHYETMIEMEELQPFESLWQHHPNLIHLLIYYIEKDMGYLELEHSKFEYFTPAYAKIAELDFADNDQETEKDFQVNNFEPMDLSSEDWYN